MQNRAYTYNITVPPATTPISLDDVKQHLRITGTADDALLTMYIEAATEYAENYTKRDLITRTYETFRDFFPACSGEGYYKNTLSLEIKRSRLQSIESIEYFYNGVLTLLDSSKYYNTLENDYSEIMPVEGGIWPNVDKRLQAIKITFKAGYGDDDSFIPAGYKQAILMHVANLYSNRGDCGGGCSSSVTISTAPNESKSFYCQQRIINL